MYLVLLGACAYAGTLTALVAWVGLWVLIPGIALMPLLVSFAVMALPRV